MQPNPKKIKPSTNQDYASIYEDNFIKTNDPVTLGQQAFTRQLSQGVQSNLQKPTPQPAAAQGTYFDRIPQIDRPVVADTGFAFTGANPTFIDPGSNTLTGGSSGGAGTASGGSSGGYTGGAGTGYGVGEGAGAATTQGAMGSTAAAGVQTAIVGQTAMIEKPVNKFVAEVQEDLKTVGEIVGEDITQAATNVATFLEDKVQKPLATAVTDAIFAAAGGEEKVVEKVIQEVTPFLQESVDPYFNGEKNFFEDATGVQIPGWLKKKRPTTVFGDYENASDNFEDEGPSLPGETGGGTKKPGDIRTGGGETKGGEITFEDADTGDYSQVVIDEETGESTTEDLTTVTTNVTNEVQTRMTELTTQLTQQISQAEQYYAREYDRILNQIAMRGRQSQVGGFTGGIQEQIAQFASAAEIQQLNALAVERNNTIQGLQSQFANIPLQAQQYANEMLTAQLQNENIRTQALSTLYTDVLNGVRTIEEAQAFADQYGLGNVQELMDRVRLAQLTLSPKINPETGEIEPYTIEDLQAMYPDKSPEELQEILDTINAGNSLVDFSILSEEEKALAENLNEALNEYYRNTTIFDEDWSEGAGAAVGAGTALVATGAALSLTGIGTIPGLFLMGVGAFLGAVVGKGLTLGQDDINALIADLGATSIIKDEENFNSLITAEAEVSITEPSVINQETIRGFGQLNDTFTLTINGTQNKIAGYQILTLAVSLEKQGVLDDPANKTIKDAAEKIYKSMPGFDFNRIIGGLSDNVINNAYNLYKYNFKK